MRQQTKRVVPAVQRMIAAYDAGTMNKRELIDAFTASFDYLIGVIEDMAKQMDDADMDLPNGVELYLVKEGNE